METEYLYQVDYAKSGRASCNKCRLSIGQSSLRLARLVQAANFDGKIPKWFHFDCFFTKNTKVNSTSEIKHFDTIRWDDQEKIRRKLTCTSGVEPKSVKYTIKLSIPDAECAKCKLPLFQERYSIQGPKSKAQHLSCFLQSGSSSCDLSSFTGFNKLKQVDQQAVLLVQSSANKENAQQKKIGKHKQATEKVEKGDGDANQTQDALREQSQRLWQTRDLLETQVSKDALIGLLEYNDQHVPSGLSNLLDAVADAMTFGALPKCPECQEGPLYYCNGAYKCVNMVTTWARCMYTTRDLSNRLAFRVPKEYHDVELLKKYNYVKRKRLFATESLPLSGLRMLVTEGPFEAGRTREQVIGLAIKRGASIVSSAALGVVLLACCSTVETLQGNPQYAKAEQLGLCVVDEKPFFEELAGDGAVTCLSAMLKKYNITPWIVIMAEESASLEGTKKSKKRRRSRAFTDSDEDTLVNMSYKGGAVVDPKSGMQDKASVLKDTKTQQPLTAVLGMVDLVKGSNSYYRLQALQSDTGPSCWLFRAWGRIGTSIGDSKLERFSTASSVREAFERLYFEKTGNEWSDRANFEKKPYKFYEMELDYDEVEEKSKKLHKASTQPSKLSAAVQALIEFICDVDSMRKTMIEFQLDLKKLPLGKLSKRQIHEAYSVLNNLTRMLDKRSQKDSDGTLDRTILISESTRFFTLIPHDFGMQTPPLLDNKQVVKAKLNMLEDLLEIELAYNMLKNEDDNESDSGKARKKPMNPLDKHYAQLKTSIKPLDPGSEEYARIIDYVRRNHGQTHSNYTLEVQSIFDVERRDEKKRFNKFPGAQHNKQLLWHGSRRTNWVGILSQGLRIAPPEAPVTGYMFGKGIYFADMVSKSANYCFTTPSQPDCLLLLCDVILGDMKLCQDADATAMPSGVHSRKGVGSVTPNPATHYTSPDGVLYPIGEPINAGVEETSLIYNEYIVYDVDQVKQKYIVRAKFVYT